MLHVHVARVARGLYSTCMLERVIDLCVPCVSPAGSTHVVFTFHVSCTVCRYNIARGNNLPSPAVFVLQKNFTEFVFANTVKVIIFSVQL